MCLALDWGHQRVIEHGVQCQCLVMQGGQGCARQHGAACAGGAGQEQDRYVDKITPVPASLADQSRAGFLWSLAVCCACPDACFRLEGMVVRETPYPAPDQAMHALHLQQPQAT